MNNQNTIITLHNIDDEDFYFEYNSSEGNPPYMIPTGEVARYPKWLANHALKHLIDKILTKKKIKINNIPERLALAEQIVVGEEKLSRAPELTPEQKLRKEVEELNKPSALETILAKRKEAKDKREKEEEEEAKETKEFREKKLTEPEEKFVGLKKEKKSKVVYYPTRAKLYEYAKKQNLVLDVKDKTGKTLKEKLDKMTVPEVVKELDYPLEE